MPIECENCGKLIFNVDDIQHGHEDICLCKVRTSPLVRFSQFDNRLSFLEASLPKHFEEDIAEIRRIAYELYKLAEGDKNAY